MLGHDHALSGALAFTAVAPLLHVTGVHLAVGAVLTAGAGARATSGHPELWWHLVPAGLILALLFSAGFRALHIGGHHGDAAGIALAVLVLWKGWDPVLVMSRHVPVLAVCVALGMLAHVAGDMCTHDGCPLLYPLNRHEFGLLPQPVRITTNKLAEHWVVSPLLIAGLAYFLWRDTGFSLTATNHLAGRL